MSDTVTDEELYSIPDLDEGPDEEADYMGNAVPLDAAERPTDNDADYEEATDE